MCNSSYIISTQVEPTASQEKPDEKPATGKSKGGQGARKARNDRRRQQQNISKSAAISTFIDLELGLKETSLLSTLKPAASNRPAGVHIRLLGASYCVRRMSERCVAIAQRPLALLLTPENRHAYERVSNLIELFLQFVTKSIQNGI
jgi:hypothetical protein